MYIDLIFVLCSSKFKGMHFCFCKHCFINIHANEKETMAARFYLNVSQSDAFSFLIQVFICVYTSEKRFKNE